MIVTQGVPCPDGSRNFGYRPDHPRVRAARVSVAALLPHFGAGAPPVSASLAAFRAPIFDQGPTGSCGGHGSAQLTATAMGSAGTPLAFVPSPAHIYANTRCEELIFPDQPLTDSGIMPSDLISALEKYGVRDRALTPGLAAGLTPDGRFSDVWAENVNVKETFEQEEQGVSSIIAGEYAIPLGPGAAALIAATIGVARRPVGIGMFVDTGFAYWSPGGGPLASINMFDPQGGGHWLSCDAYTTDAHGAYVFTLCNSWSSSWGDSGQIQITASALVSAMSDAIAWTVRTT
jgi:hypothetical protein